MTELERQSQRVTKALARAVAEALERKRRLGQYAVIYKDGKVVRIEPDRIAGPEHR